MSKTEKRVRWAQVLSLLAIIALFVADIGLDILAKEVPGWVYPMLGLLALGVEAPALSALRHGAAARRGRRWWGRRTEVGIPSSVPVTKKVIKGLLVLLKV